MGRWHFHLVHENTLHESLVRGWSIKIQVEKMIGNAIIESTTPKFYRSSFGNNKKQMNIRRKKQVGA